MADAASEERKVLGFGEVEWHSSEEDSGPDVGIAIGFGGEAALWLGELLNRDGAHFGFVFQDGKGGRHVVPLPGDDDLALRDMLEQRMAPAMRAVGGLRNAVAAALWEHDRKVAVCPDKKLDADKPCPRCNAMSNEGCRVTAFADAMFVSAVRAALNTDPSHAE